MSGFENTLTAEEANAILAALDARRDFARQRDRVVHRLRYPLRLIPWPPRRFPFSLIREVDGCKFQQSDVPRFWRVAWQWHRDAALVMPLWLYWPYIAWQRRYWFWRALMSLGVWEVEEGCYYSPGRIRCPRPVARALWCFVNDCDSRGAA